MSIINSAFDVTEHLYTPFEVDSEIQDEPLYIDLTTNFGVKQEPMYKRVGDIRASLLITDEEVVEDVEVIEELKYMIPFMARITNNQGNGANKWLYEWEEMIMDQNGSVVSKTGGLGSTKKSLAQNLMEHANTNACVGPGVFVQQGEGYPAEWAVQPIGGEMNCLLQPVVVMYKVLVEGTIEYKYVFQAENAHDGTCEI
jgi:hypothetical protein